MAKSKFYVQVRSTDRAQFIIDAAHVHSCEPSTWKTPRGGDSRHVHVEGDEADLRTVQRVCGIRGVEITNLSGGTIGRE